VEKCDRFGDLVTSVRLGMTRFDSADWDNAVHWKQ